MNFFETIARFFQNGGHFMYPIAVVLVIGVAIALERWFYLTVSRSRNRSLWQQIEPLLGQGNFRQAAQVASQSDSAVGQILNYGLARVTQARRRDDIEKAMEESLMGIVPKLEKPALDDDADIIDAFEDKSAAAIDDAEVDDEAEEDAIADADDNSESDWDADESDDGPALRHRTA